MVSSVFSTEAGDTWGPYCPTCPQRVNAHRLLTYLLIRLLVYSGITNESFVVTKDAHGFSGEREGVRERWVDGRVTYGTSASVATCPTTTTTPR